MNNLNEELKPTKGKRTKTLFSKKKVLIFVLVIAAGIAGFFAVRGIVNGASAKDSLELRTSVAIKGNLSVAVTGSGPAQSSSKKSVTASVNGTLLESYENKLKDLPDAAKLEKDRQSLKLRRDKITSLKNNQTP